MRQILYSQPIARPPAAVWAYLADLRNDVAWRAEIKRVELIEGSPRELAARYREIVAWQGMEAEAILTIVDSVEGSRLVVTSDGPGYRSRSSWRFEPHPTGTLVMLSFSLETTGTLHLAEPVLWSIVTNWLARDLPLLEGHLSAVK